jgi:uncharacterized protein YbaP (TraB family)
MARPARLALIVLTLALCRAQAPLSEHEVGPANEVWSQQIESVVVNGDARGPAIWRVRRAGSEIWILGTVGPMPEDLAWNTDSLTPLLAGARQVLLPPAPDVNLVDAAWFYLWHGDMLRQKRGTTLEASLSDTARARFIAARTLAGQDADRYATDIPLAAAMRLQRDFLTSRGLTREQPRKAVEAAARRARIPVNRMGSFELMPTVRQVLQLPQERQRPCLDQAVADTERQAQHARNAAEAWADGNVAAVKVHYAETRLLECVAAASAQAAAINAVSVTLMADNLDKALKMPGKSVAIISIGPLLRQGGVLEKLAALGATVDHPAE